MIKGDACTAEAFSLTLLWVLQEENVKQLGLFFFNESDARALIDKVRIHMLDIWTTTVAFSIYMADFLASHHRPEVAEYCY